MSSVPDKNGVHVDAWKLYCEAWHEAFPRSQLEPTLSMAALQMMVDKMLATGGVIYQAMLRTSAPSAMGPHLTASATLDHSEVILTFRNDEEARAFYASVNGSSDGGGA